MIIEVVGIGRASVSILITVCPGTLVLTMWGHQLLLHGSIVSVNRPWLSSTLFVGLRLFLQSLRVLLISLNQLDLFLGSFAVGGLTRILRCLVL